MTENRPAWLDAPLPRQLPPPPDGFAPTVADWLADAERILVHLCKELGIDDTRALGGRADRERASGTTAWDAFRYQEAMQASGAEGAELLVEAALRFLWVAKERAPLADHMGAMNHIAMAYYCIGQVTPVAADLARRRQRAAEGWEDLLEAARKVIRKHGRPGKWTSISHAFKSLSDHITTAAEGLPPKAGQKSSDEPAELVRSWCGKGGPLEAELKQFLVPKRRAVVPVGVPPRVRRQLSPFAPHDRPNLLPRAKKPPPQRAL